MEVALLGSGSADGWPNPFCRCASCEAQRTSGVRRVATSALVDGVLLLDLGPDTPRQAEALGLDASGVHNVLVTHAHPDHLAPAALLWRRWALGPDSPALTVLGPPSTTDEVMRWFGDEPTVRTRTLHAGDQVGVGGYAVAALPAAHEVETLLYDVASPDGARLLYATDTGPLPRSTLRQVQGRHYDVVLLEQTFGHRHDHGTLHLDLDTFPRALAALRGAGAVDENTRVVAVHLGHHNPPEAELRAALARWGVEPGRDGMRLSIPGPGRAGSQVTVPTPERGVRHARVVDPGPREVAARSTSGHLVPRRCLVVGGARSGKSSLAEAMLADAGAVVYVATGEERCDDPEWRDRVAAHQARRPGGWTTTTTTDLVPLLDDDGPALLIDCLTLWLTAAMDEVGAWDEPTWRTDGQSRLFSKVDELAAAWRRTRRRVVAVTNEVGGGVVPDTWAGRVFRDEMGRLNARIAAESDQVSLVVAGLETRLR